MMAVNATTATTMPAMAPWLSVLSLGAEVALEMRYIVKEAIEGGSAEVCEIAGSLCCSQL
jgi:hypothetical protein